MSDKARHTPGNLLGKKWQGHEGRTWEVVENLYFGRWIVRTTDLCRVGEMRGKDIVLAITKAGQNGHACGPSFLSILKTDKGV